MLRAIVPANQPLRQMSDGCIGPAATYNWACVPPRELSPSHRNQTTETARKLANNATFATTVQVPSPLRTSGPISGVTTAAPVPVVIRTFAKVAPPPVMNTTIETPG